MLNIARVLVPRSVVKTGKLLLFFLLRLLKGEQRWMTVALMPYPEYKMMILPIRLVMAKAWNV